MYFLTLFARSVTFFYATLTLTKVTVTFFYPTLYHVLIHKHTTYEGIWVSRQKSSAPDKIVTRQSDPVMINNFTMLAYYHMMIHISLCQFDQTILKGVIALFTWTISSKSLFVQLLYFKWEFFTGRKLKDRQYNGQKKKGNKTNNSWASDCCLTLTQQYFSYIIVRTS